MLLTKNNNSKIMTQSLKRIAKYINNSTSTISNLEFWLKIACEDLKNLCGQLKAIDLSLVMGEEDITRRNVIEEFCGNAVDLVKNITGEPVVVMSARYCNVDEIVNRLIRPKVDSIGKIMADNNVEGSLAEDIFKCLNQFLVDLNISGSINSIPRPSTSPQSSGSVETGNINSHSNSPQSTASSDYSEVEIPESVKVQLKNFSRNQLPHRYFILNIDNSNKIVIDKTGPRGYGLTEFKADLMRNGDCRFGVYSCEGSQKPCLILWCPESADVNMKKKYHAKIEMITKISESSRFIQLTNSDEAESMSDGLQF